MLGPSYTKTANGNITPMTFICLVGGSNDLAVIATGTTVPIWGISARGVRNAPLALLDDGYLAILNQAFACFGPGDGACRLIAGGTVSAGQLLTSDSTGRGIAATAGSSQYVGAVALINGVVGDEIEVLPYFSYRDQ